MSGSDIAGFVGRFLDYWQRSDRHFSPKRDQVVFAEYHGKRAFVAVDPDFAEIEWHKSQQSAPEGNYTQ